MVGMALIKAILKVQISIWKKEPINPPIKH
jgi:hypothetical protein